MIGVVGMTSHLLKTTAIAGISSGLAFDSNRAISLDTKKD
jgi:hypothetical protein